MKKLAYLLIALFCSSEAFAQDRALGGNSLVLDNGNGGTLTIVYTGTSHQTLYLNDSSGGGGSLPEGTVNQTLRHNGTTWVADGNLLNTGSQVSIGGGVFYGIRTVDQDEQLTETDHIVLIDPDSTDITVTLPPATPGRKITVRLADLFSESCEQCPEILVVPNSEDESIDGFPSVELSDFTPGGSFVSDGTMWHTVDMLLIPF